MLTERLGHFLIHLGRDLSPSDKNGAHKLTLDEAREIGEEALKNHWMLARYISQFGPPKSITDRQDVAQRVLGRYKRALQALIKALASRDILIESLQDRKEVRTRIPEPPKKAPQPSREVQPTSPPTRIIPNHGAVQEVMAELVEARERLAALDQQNQTLSDANRELRTKNRTLVDIAHDFQAGKRVLSDAISENRASSSLPPILTSAPTGAPSFNTDKTVNTDKKVEWFLAGQLQTIPVPETLVDIKPWVDTHLAGKVELLPRAAKEAKRAIFEDVPLVYKALLLLGTRRDMLVTGGLEQKRYFEDKLRELHLSNGASISVSIPDEYYVRWNGERRLMDLALKRGTESDPRKTMRIYYFFDRDTTKIVVGSMPAHLRNQLS